MILIDGNQLMIAGILADQSNIMVNEELVRHVTLNSLRFWRKKHKNQYGELVIAFDSRKSWRKDVYPHYKANRKKNRDNSALDWNEIFRLIEIVKQELIDNFPYKVIEVEGCEGDDVIATLSRWAVKNEMNPKSMFDEPMPVLVVSSDEDFLQLHTSHIQQASLKTKKLIPLEHSIEFIVHDHICRGDKGDGVPNVLSDDLVFIEERRQKSIFDVKVKEWFEKLPEDEAFKKNYQRNKTLVDLSCIPEEYQQKIIDKYIEYKPQSRSKLLNYFVSNRLKLLMNDLQDF